MDNLRLCYVWWETELQTCPVVWGWERSCISRWSWGTTWCCPATGPPPAWTGRWGRRWSQVSGTLGDRCQVLYTTRGSHGASRHVLLSPGTVTLTEGTDISRVGRAAETISVAVNWSIVISQSREDLKIIFYLIDYRKLLGRFWCAEWWGPRHQLRFSIHNTDRLAESRPQYSPPCKTTRLVKENKLGIEWTSMFRILLTKNPLMDHILVSLLSISVLDSLLSLSPFKKTLFYKIVHCALSIWSYMIFILKFYRKLSV